MRNIFDFKYVKSVSVLIFIDKKTKELAGKIIANYSDAGSVTSQIILYNPEKYGLVERYNQIALGKAGGYGYDKLSASIADGLMKGFKKLPSPIRFDSAGIGAVQSYFDSLGLELIEVL